MKRNITYSLLLVMGIQVPLYAREFTLYNYTAKEARISLNVSAQWMNATVPVGGKVVFDYGGGRSGLCLTQIYANGKKAKLSTLSKAKWGIMGTTLGLTAAILAFGAAAGPIGLLASLPEAIGFLFGGSMITAFVVIAKLCKSSSWLIGEGEDGMLYAITKKDKE